MTHLTYGEKHLNFFELLILDLFKLISALKLINDMIK